MREIPGCYCLRSHFLDDMSQTTISLCLKFNYIPYIAIYHTYIYIIYLLNGLSPSKPPLVSQLRCSCCSCSLMKSLREFSRRATVDGRPGPWPIPPWYTYIYMELNGYNWLEVYLPLWKYESAGIIIPNIWKNNPNVPNHQPYIYMYI